MFLIGFYVLKASERQSTYAACCILYTKETCYPKLWKTLFQDNIQNATSEVEEVKVAMLENENKAEELKDVNQKPEKPQCTVSTVSS